MSKKNNGDRPTASAADRIFVQDALAKLLVCFWPKEKHYYNFLGNNDDGLMHALGCGPLTYGAIMYTANVLGLKKKRGESCDVFYVRTDTQNGWDEMVSRHGLTDVDRTTFRKAQFVGLGTINPRAADALHSNRCSWLTCKSTSWWWSVLEKTSGDFEAVRRPIYRSYRRFYSLKSLYRCMGR